MATIKVAARSGIGSEGRWARAFLVGALLLVASLLAPSAYAAAVYYSVGTSFPADLKSGSPTVDIAAGTATFSVAQPDNVGVGDEITYNGATKAYISGRTNSFIYSVVTATGVAAPNIAGATVNSIKRAFGTLTTAEANSTDATHLNTSNLVTGSYQLNWTVYNDGAMNDGDITIQGYTTGAANYIRIFAPAALSEVGVSQRHRGKAGTGFRLTPVIDTPPNPYEIIHIFVPYVRIEGIEIDGSGVTTAADFYAIRVDSSVSATSDVRFDKLIIHHIANSTRDQATTPYDVWAINVGGASAKVGNTIIYHLELLNNNASSDVTGIKFPGANTGTHYIYNNTLYDIKNSASTRPAEGLSQGGGTVTARNNVVLDVVSTFGAESCFAGTITQNNNVSSDATATGAGSQINKTSYATYFVSITGGSEDLHIREGSNALWGSYGADLDSDVNLPITDDTDGQVRPATQPDIGADEHGAAVYYSVGSSTANLRSSPTLTMTISAGRATFSEPQANKIGVGDKITYNGATVAYISGRTSATVYSVLTAVGATPPNVVGATVNSILRAFNTLTAANAGSADATHLNLAGPPYNLVAAKVQLNWPLYNDGPLDDRPTITNWTTGPTNYIRIYVPFLLSEVGAIQRHSGRAGTGFRLRPSTGGPGSLMVVQEEYVRVEGIEIDGTLLNDAVIAIYVPNTVTTTSDVRIDGTIIHDLYNSVTAAWHGGIISFGAAGTGAKLSVSNNIIYDLESVRMHVCGICISADPTSYVYNNTVYRVRQTDNDGLPSSGAAWGISAQGAAAAMFAKNNYVGDVSATFDTVFPCYSGWNSGVLTQTTNVSSDATGSPASLRNKNVYANYFKSITAGSENLHLKNDSFTLWGSFGTDLDTDANLPVTGDTDREARSATQPDHGPDEFSVPTVVELLSFEALGLDGAVELRWTTGSELWNLGFHLYRSLSAEGPYERITSAVIPGLGSSPVGESYRYVDTGLANGVTYFYRLEDIETTGETELHGPVQATPQAGAPAPAPAPPSPPGGLGIRYGDPAQNGLRLTRLSASEVLLELVTAGFYAIPQPDGSVRIEVPGFEGGPGPGAPWIPTKRTWVEAVAGRGVRLGDVGLGDVVALDGLRPVAGGLPEMTAGEDGTVRAVLRQQQEGSAFRRAGLYPEEAARLVEVAFQGDVKKALVDLSPLRWDPASRQLLLAKRLSVRVMFAGAETSERSLGGSRGRQEVSKASKAGNVLARLVTRGRGLYGVRFEDVFGLGPGMAASRLLLTRQGEAVAYHLEPDARTYGRGSILYFVSEGSALNPWGREAVYELSVGSAGAMPLVEAAPYGPAAGFYWKRTEWEQNKNYQPGLLEATDLWQWEGLVSPVTKSYAFTVSQLAAAGEPSHLAVYLEGASDFEANPDHHVRVSVNGMGVGETSWDGARPGLIEAELPVGLLREGANQLQIENVGDTGAAYSYVFLDKFALSYPRRLEAEAGVVWGSFSQSGSAEVSGLSSALIVDTTAQPRWVKGGGAGFAVEAGRSYLAVDPSAVMRPEVRRPGTSGLRRRENRAEYVVIGPREFLGAAEPLLERRRSQGLAVKSVAVEDVYEEFGHGEASPSAIKEFLAYAYHHWQAPSLRYVLLLGDGSYDFKGYLPTEKPNRVLPLILKTTYLWTASDPSYGAVNGADALPDVAVGRLSASSLGEAQALVDKVLAFEDSGEGLSGNAVLVADNADLAGQFEEESDEVASMLADRQVEKIYLRDQGSGTRAAIASAFNRGASLMSYVGHGGVALWTSENVFNNGDVTGLVPQARQPFLMTMNCLNGFFHGPALDSLSEVLLKAPDKGAIAAFSPSGLSLDEFADEYAKALIGELQAGRQERLGDVILAAQAAYADTGAMPELLSIFHLLGDPALKIR